MYNQGRMVTAEGNLVQPTITIPPNSTGLTINAQGQVSVTLPGSTTSSILGQLQLTTFINDAGLQAQGSNLFVATPASGQPQNNTPGLNNSGTLLQGSLEQSNVSAVTEITNLIQAQRAYEMNSKVITAADQMLQTTAQLMR
jgi:flagellar basal-body rod protein FlgG